MALNGLYLSGFILVVLAIYLFPHVGETAKNSIDPRSSSTSQVTQNLAFTSVDSLNKQIRSALESSYKYTTMAYSLDRDTVALPGFSKYFKVLAGKERERSEKLMAYLNMRGGRIKWRPIKSPVKQEWDGGLEAMSEALAIERSLNSDLLDLHRVASYEEDPHMTNFIEDEMLTPKVELIKKMADLITHLTSFSNEDANLGEYIVDRKLG